MKHPLLKVFAFLSAVILLLSCQKETSSVTLPPAYDEFRWCGDTIVAWGDSFTEELPGIVSYTRQLQDSLHQYVINAGVSGESSIQIIERFKQHPELHKYPTIVWMGTNDRWDTLNIRLRFDTIASMLTHKKFLFLGLMPLSLPSSSPHYIASQYTFGFDSTMEKRYGKHYIVANKELQANALPSPSPDDDYVAWNVVPESLRAPNDPVHLNTKGQTVITRVMLSRLTQCTSK